MKKERLALNTFSLKVIAVVAMTLDHIRVYFPFLPVQLRWFGRLPIPIFMFLTIEGFFHTKDRKEYMKRLYFAGIVTQFIFMLVGWSNSFIKVLFILTVLLWILEQKTWKRKSQYFVLFLLYQIMSHTIVYAILELIFLRNPVIDFLSFLLFDFDLGGFCIKVSIAALGIVITGEDVLILAFGLLIYLTKDNRKIFLVSGTLFGICYFLLTTTDLVVRVISKLNRLGFPMLAASLEFLRPFFGLGHFNIGGNPWTENYQWMMVFSLPLLLLYNGEKGKDRKNFFYIYYPLHIVVLTLIRFFI